MSRWRLVAWGCTTFYRHTVVPIIEPVAVSAGQHQRPHFSGNSNNIIVISSTVDLTLSIVHRDLSHATNAAIGCACWKNTASTPNPRLSSHLAELAWPDGLALSPDSSKLYISHCSVEEPFWYVYDVNEDGSVSNRSLFFDGRPILEMTVR